MYLVIDEDASLHSEQGMVSVIVAVSITVEVSSVNAVSVTVPVGTVISGVVFISMLVMLALGLELDDVCSQGDSDSGVLV